ncbi:MAG: magnesium protoporphyrin IX methyltransferase [Chloracidobacterium sp.]|uniref:Magnesium protoporphyrin IX methyltransferase n=1 Tax=Chloracidobacterium validum TaxID=2821543 RepID=A0ABX8B5I2_9BACT|nr:magnesium protoporphyrin IX methyltransferase [Chloracidobacterium validum]QUW01909.1 magnesium protoporphyrin IX methyltransferase [Chloracidobacterium validum]
MAQSYATAQDRIRQYFDTVGFEKWQRFARGEAQNRIQASIVAGREQTMATILDWGGDWRGQSVLDAGCGTGAFARRLVDAGARVTGVDISAREVAAAKERVPEGIFRQADFYGVSETFDTIVCLDSLIYYAEDDLLQLLQHLGRHMRTTLYFTFTPSTVFFEVMHTVGKLFPKGNTSPAIAQIKAKRLYERLATETTLRLVRTTHISSSFYQTTLVELRQA